MTQRILIMAGGTGGHVFPGLAVADYMKGLGWEAQWLGTAERMEAELVPSRGYPIHFIDVAGVRGNGLVRLLAAPFKIIKSILQARKVMKSFKPDVVLGMGGFASGPGGIAAWMSSIPLILHEQNARAGMTNRILSRFAHKVLEAFPNTFAGSKVIEVGNPVRQDILELPKPEDRINQTEKVRVLIVGGSLGAKVLNDVVPETLSELSQQYAIDIMHQCGKGNSIRVQNGYQGLSSGSKASVNDFIDDMAAAYSEADLVICRAGALTVSEITALGVAAIFVPLPHAVDDHQTANASVLASKDAAIILPQPQLLAGNLKELCSDLFAHKDKLLQMAQKGFDRTFADATQRVANECIQAGAAS